MVVEVAGLRLFERLADGASASVWRAEHALTRHPLAVKFLRGNDAHYETMISREAMALARLDHRHVASIYDLGALDARVEGVADAGAPYLVMELAELGASSAHRAHWTPDHVATALDQTLGALAHVHARGLLHLDLKPSNVLLAAHERRTCAEIRVVDLGLGAIFEGLSVGGTPGFMAPEQLDPAGGEITTRTDLFGVGRLALWWLSADGLDMLEPAWRSWVARLVDPDPTARFASAASARHALGALCTGAPLPLVSPRGVTTPPLDSTGYSTVVSLGVVEQDEVEVGTPISTPLDASRVDDAPPMRPTWRLDHPARPWYRLAGLGTGVFARRAPRLVGHLAARDALWASLAASERDGAVHVEVRDAAPGARALTRWFGVRAAELLDAAHVEFTLGGVEGLTRLAAALATPRRIASAALSRWRAQEAARAQGNATLEARELTELCALLLAELSAERRVIISAREASPNDLATLERLSTVPVSLGTSITATTKHINEFNTLMMQETQPLSHDELGALAHQAVGLDPVLIDELVARADGSARFVMRAIETWLARDALVPGPRGLKLAQWQDPWSTERDAERVDLVVDALDADGRVALASLLTLGPGIDEGAWEDALRALGVSVPRGLLARLLVSGLVREVGAGARELSPGIAGLDGALARALGPELSDPALGDACLAAYPGVARSHATRLWRASVLTTTGRHGRARDELEPLLVAGLDAQVAAPCLALLERLEAHLGDDAMLRLLRARCLYAMGEHDADAAIEGIEPESTTERFALREMRLIAALGRGDFGTASTLGEELNAMLDMDLPEALVPRIHSALARLGIHTKRYDEAARHARAAIATVEDLPTLELSVRNMLAISLSEGGRLDEARDQMEAALELARALGSSKFEVITTISLGDLEMRRERWPDARRWFQDGLEVGRERYPLAAYLHGNLAWVALNMNEPDTALEHLDEARGRLGQTSTIVGLYLLELRPHAFTLLENPEAWDQAMGELEDVLEHVQAYHEEGVAASERDVEIWAERGDEARSSRAAALTAALVSRR